MRACWCLQRSTYREETAAGSGGGGHDQPSATTLACCVLRPTRALLCCRQLPARAPTTWLSLTPGGRQWRAAPHPQRGQTCSLARAWRQGLSQPAHGGPRAVSFLRHGAWRELAQAGTHQQAAGARVRQQACGHGSGRPWRSRHGGQGGRARQAALHRRLLLLHVPADIMPCCQRLHARWRGWCLSGRIWRGCRELMLRRGNWGDAGGGASSRCCRARGKLASTQQRPPTALHTLRIPAAATHTTLPVAAASLGCVHPHTQRLRMHAMQSICARHASARPCSASRGAAATPLQQRSSAGRIAAQARFGGGSECANRAAACMAALHARNGVCPGHACVGVARL